jgi:predicted ATPase
MNQEEDSLKDQIADLLNAFESLFKNGEETSDIETRIAVRCSQLLSKNDEEKQEIKRVFNEAYRIRNQLVNRPGSEKSEEDSDYAWDVISRTRDYLRLAIKCII